MNGICEIDGSVVVWRSGCSERVHAAALQRALNCVSEQSPRGTIVDMDVVRTDLERLERLSEPFPVRGGGRSAASAYARGRPPIGDAGRLVPINRVAARVLKREAP